MKNYYTKIEDTILNKYDRKYIRLKYLKKLHKQD